MNSSRWHWLVVSVTLAAACGGIGGSSDTGSAAPRTSGGATPNGAADQSAAGSGSANTGAPGAAMGPVQNLPPEIEASVDLQLPQASENYVYAANPNAGTVAIIDAQTQAIKTVKTGSRPTYLRTLEGTDHAIVLNVGSNKASIIRMQDGTPQKTDLPVNPGANAIAVAPDGKHAVVYYNANYMSAGSTPGSYQDVAVLDISDDGSADASISMTVGFQPRDVFFNTKGTQAYAVTEDGVSVLDFAAIQKSGPSIAKLVTFGGGVDQKNLDVAITPDGQFALARAQGQGALHLVELATGKVRTLDLASVYAPESASDADAGTADLPVIVTDLDLMPTGGGALAVLRNQSAVLKLALPEAFDDPSQVKTIHAGAEVVGSVTIAPDGRSALGYTTAASIDRLVIIDLAEDAAPRTVLLRKAIHAVAFTPDSKTALITHTKATGSPDEPGITPEQQLDRSYGYSLLRVTTGDVKLERTATQLGPIAMVPDASYLFILFRDDTANIKEVQRVALKSFLVAPIIQLENPPISIGIANASRAVFVNLAHPDGRMTFMDWDQPLEKLKTVTGFELNSRIRN